MPRAGKAWWKRQHQHHPVQGTAALYNAETSRNKSTNSIMIFHSFRECHGTVLDGIIQYGVRFDADVGEVECRDETWKAEGQ